MKKRELFSYIRTLGVILGFVFLVLAGVSVFRVFAQLQSENSFEISTPAEVSVPSFWALPSWPAASD